MSNVDNLECCGRFMLRVTGEKAHWDCPVCGTRRNREGTVITPGETNGTDASVDFQPEGQDGARPHGQGDSRPDGQGGSRSDGRVADREDASPDEPHTGRRGDEDPDGSSAGPAPATDYRPRCWKCGRVLGRYVSRPWSIRCRRCKTTNQGVLSTKAR